jgi:hypothetical protein
LKGHTVYYKEEKDGRAILTSILRNWVLRELTGLIWLTEGNSGALL